MIELLSPRSVTDAVGMLRDHPEARLVAGGTDVMLDLRVGRMSAGALIDLSPLAAELSGVHLDGASCRIGAMTSIRAIEDHPGLARRAAGIGEAARVLGSPQIRTMATLGGNLAHGTPSAEMPPPLLVHGASIEMIGDAGPRTIPLADLAVAPGRTAMKRAEILTGVMFDSAPNGFGSVYLRQTVRWAMDLAGVGVAAGVEVEGDRIVTARVALGAVNPVSLLVGDLEGVLTGQSYERERAIEAGRIAAAACSPITDARGSADYRRRVVAALVPRAIRIAWLRATNQFDQRWAPINGLLNEEAQ